MIKFISGPKGFGKTKIIIDEANKAVGKANGNVVFITDTKRYMYDLDRAIRFLDVNDYSITNEDMLIGFINGIIGCDFDKEYIFVDGIVRMLNKPMSEMKEIVLKLDEISRIHNLKIILTASCAENETPDFVKERS